VPAWLAESARRGMPDVQRLEHLRLPSSLADPFKRLVDSGLRLTQLRSEASLHDFLIDEVTELSGAERVLLVLQGASGRHIAGALLPAGEDAAALLRAVSPWLDEAAATHEPRLRHGPEGAAEEAQRSCLVAPLVAQGELLGHLYADIEGAFGRFGDADRDLLAMLAALAAVALANLRFAGGLEAQVAVRTADLREALQQQTATAEVLQVISSSVADAQPVLDKILESCRQLINAQGLGILLIGEDGRLHVAASLAVGLEGRPGWSQAEMDIGIERIRSVFPMALEGSGTALTIANGSVLNYPDVLHGADVPDSVRLPARQAGRNCAQMMAPLMQGQRGIGSIILQRAALGGFTPKEEALLKTFADQAVIAIQNAKMFRETNEALERQTATAEILKVIASSPADVQPVFDAVADRARLLCGAEVSSVTRFDGEWLHMVSYRGASAEAEAEMRAAFPVKPGHGSVNARAIVTAAPAQVPDIRLDPNYQLTGPVSRAGLRSMLGVPMLQHGQVIGVIGLGRKAPGPYSDASIQLLQAFADQAVIAIENTRLFNETQEALQRQTATAEVLQVISSSVADAQPVFDAIVRSAARLFGRKTALRTVEPEGLRSRARSYELTAEEFHGPELMPINRHSLVGRAVLDGRTLQVADNRAPDTNGTFFASQAQELSFRSIASAPLMQDGVAIGVISMSSPEPGALTEPQMALLSAFADQAVIAIRNARLFNETQEALEQRTATAEILKVVARSPSDVQPVFDAIVVAAPPLVGGFSCVVALREGGLMRLVARTPLGASDDDESWKERTTPIDGNRLYERAVRDRAPTQIADIQRDTKTTPEFRAYAQARGFRSAVAIPLLADGEVIGAFSVSCVEPRRFSDRELDLLSTFADQAVIAIRNTRLFNVTQEALAHQTASADILRVISSSPTDVQPVFEAIVGTAVKHLGCDLALVQTVSGDTYSPKAMATPTGLTPVPGAQVMPVDPAANFPSRAICSKTMLHVPAWTAVELPPHEKVRHQQLGLNSALYLPLVRSADCVGVLVLGSKQANAFNPKAIALAESFRDQALIAIENTRLFNETQEALEQQTATAEVLQVVSNSMADSQPVLDKVLDSCARLFRSYLQSVNLLGDDGAIHLAAVKWSEVDDDPAYQAAIKSMNDVNRKVYPLKLSARALTTLQQMRGVLSWADVLNGPDVPPIVRKPAVAAGISYAQMMAPLISGDRHIGNITVIRKVHDAFSDKEQALLKSFTDQAVVAIQNARLFRETNEALERQTATAEILAVISESPTDVQPVFQAIAERARTLCGADVGATTRLDGDVVHLAGVRALSTQAEEGMRAGFPMALEAAPPNIRRAIAEQQPIQIADVHVEPGYPSAEVAQRSGFRSILSVPLLHQGRSIGTIGVARREPGRFADGAVALLQTFARQAVIAIENVRLFNETKEALDRQTATAEVLQVISQSMADAQPVFERILDSAGRLFASEREALVLMPGDGQVYLAAIRGTDSEAVKALYPVPIERTSMPALAELRRQICHLDAANDPAAARSLRDAAAATATGSFSIVMTPLLWQDKVIGSLNITRRTGLAFVDKELALLRSFADQAVIAIQNARLFRETQEALEHQTATSEVLNVIAASVDDAQPVFDKIIDSAAQLFPDALALMILQTDAQDMLHVAGIRFVGD
ncbi:MAG: GAF domain-containing protein, partial [Rubrivivax sp.]